MGEDGKRGQFTIDVGLWLGGTYEREEISSWAPKKLNYYFLSAISVGAVT
jgi:hypothetical protein